MEHADAASIVTDKRIQLVSLGLSGTFRDASSTSALAGTLTSGNLNMNDRNQENRRSAKGR